MRLRCNKCGESASSEVPDNTVLRGWVECPECIEKDIDIEVIEQALLDVLEGNSAWWEIQENTGESKERCMEIEKIYHDLRKCNEAIKELHS